MIPSKSKMGHAVALKTGTTVCKYYIGLQVFLRAVMVFI